MGEKKNDNKKPENQIDENGEICANCKHFLADAANLKLGNCLRFPPQVSTHMFQNPHNPQEISVQARADFPLIQRVMHCGEFSRKVQA